MPAEVAIRAASIFVTMPPVPTADPRRETSTPTRSASLRTSVIRSRVSQLRVTGVEAVHVAEQDQCVGMHQVRDQRGQPVVVAEPDLVGRDRVVLVDHRHDAELEQPPEGLVSVAVVTVPGDVVDGEQHLTDLEAVPPEAMRVVPHQQALTHRRRRLLGGEILRTRLQAERGQAGRDRARGDEHDFPAGQPSGGECGHQLLDPRRVDSARRGRQRRRTDLDHDAVSTGDLRTSGSVIWRPRSPTTAHTAGPHIAPGSTEHPARGCGVHHGVQVARRCMHRDAAPGRAAPCALRRGAMH